MRQQQAKTLILAEWRLRPEAEKSASAALAFAMKIQTKYPFRGTGDPCQRINNWLGFGGSSLGPRGK
jgi:hypothetical protein